MNTGPLDELPRVLTPEAERDKHLWLASIANMKGKHRLDNIRLWISRYNEVPQIPDLAKPI